MSREFIEMFNPILNKHSLHTLEMSKGFIEMLPEFIEMSTEFIEMFSPILNTHSLHTLEMFTEFIGIHWNV